MIVVVILALLGVLAVNIYRRYTMKARTSEALAMLAHIKAKQEAYHAEHFRYADIPTFHPGTVKKDEKVPFAPLPAAWQQLGIQAGNKSVYFQYNVISDAGNVATVPPGGHAVFGLTAGQPWFIAQARAKFDDYSTTDTTFEVTNNRESVFKIDKFGHRSP
jgi:Tfp pilus assembly protein PilE